MKYNVKVSVERDETFEVEADDAHKAAVDVRKAVEDPLEGGFISSSYEVTGENKATLIIPQDEI